MATQSRGDEMSFSKVVNRDDMKCLATGRKALQWDRPPDHLIFREFPRGLTCRTGFDVGEQLAATRSDKQRLRRDEHQRWIR